MNQQPPKWISRFLQLVCRPEILEEIAGDLMEFYGIWIEKHGIRKANLLYFWHSIKFLRWYAVRKPNSRFFMYFSMYQNHFKIAKRALFKHKASSLINISGLSVGLACCLLISVYIKDELSYDHFHKNSEKIYRVSREFKSPDGSTTLHLASLAPPFLPLLKEDFPEMETITRFLPQGGPFRFEDKLFNEEDVGWADKEFFKVFSFDFVAGNPATALDQARSLVVTEEIANKYFGTTDVLGKIISHHQINFQVTGVIKKMPENAHFNFDIIGDFSFAEDSYGGPEKMMKAWSENNLSHYFLLKEGSNIAQIESRFPAFLSKHLDEEANNWTALHIQKMTDIHLHSNLELELRANSDIKYVYTLIGIALLILFIAVINYMNLTTAKSANRAREVGIRKVIGAQKLNLIVQFLIESILLVELAAIFALILVQLFLPYLRAFTGKKLVFSTTEGLIATLVMLAFGFLIAILAGTYPAFYLSSFRSLNVLKGKLTNGIKNSFLRRSLVIVQFTISATMMASTVIVFQQVDYMQNKKLGYEKSHILTTYMNHQVRDKFDLLKTTLLANSSIQNVTRSHGVPTDQLLSYADSKVEINGEMLQPTENIINFRADHEFLDTYGIMLKAGRDFDEHISSDQKEAFILNETAVKMIGWPSNEAAIGRKIHYGGKQGKVIGVIEDVHFETFRNRITPQIIHPHGNMSKVSIKMSCNEIFETVAFIESTWGRFFPETPISYHFVDEQFNKLYQAEEKRSKLFSAFSLLAIFLACLGLFGLASFTVAARSKEISIRKVLGATVAQISSTLSREFIVMVGISVVIGFPLTILVMHDWLENYAYRISIDYFPFLVSSVFSLIIAVATVGSHIYKTAVKNPVEYLKDD